MELVFSMIGIGMFCFIGGFILNEVLRSKGDGKMEFKEGLINGK